MTEPVALALTLVIELPVWVVLLGARLSVSAPWAMAVAVVANVVSHPLLWFVMIPLGEAAIGSTVVAIAVSEALVVVLEAALAGGVLHLAGRGSAVGTGAHRRHELLITALLANALSWAVGVVLIAALDLP